MKLPARIGLITLACRDVERMAQLFRGGFSWRDPEGNVWDVAWARGTTLDERGGLTFP